MPIQSTCTPQDNVSGALIETPVSRRCNFAQRAVLLAYTYLATLSPVGACSPRSLSAFTWRAAEDQKLLRVTELQRPGFWKISPKLTIAGKSLMNKISTRCRRPFLINRRYHLSATSPTCHTMKSGEERLNERNQDHLLSRNLHSTRNSLDKRLAKSSRVPHLGAGFRLFFCARLVRLYELFFFSSFHRSTQTFLKNLFKTYHFCQWGGRQKFQ